MSLKKHHLEAILRLTLMRPDVCPDWIRNSVIETAARSRAGTVEGVICSMPSFHAAPKKNCEIELALDRLLARGDIHIAGVTAEGKLIYRAAKYEGLPCPSAELSA
jgi:hypothetical protein